jgi:aspartate/methionine/tyrosine aminotransferase
MPKDHSETIDEAHKVFLKYHAQSSISGDDHEHENSFPQFQSVAKTGVIYATSRAIEKGFDPDDINWSNMGQGAPETGPIEGAPHRDFTLNIPDSQLEYAPVTGLHELRVKVAEYYNHLYREGHDSKYSAENVCIVPGGRAGITRIMAILSQTQVSYFRPDYTAYEQALGLFLSISPTPLLHRNVNEAVMDPEEFEFQVSGRGAGVTLLSNPANPTGQSIEGEWLEKYVEIARKYNSSLIMDEFYSHYYYDGDAVDPVDGGVDDISNFPKTVSSAKYIEDVDYDPILIVNGLTKNWRCPGFRIAWIVAPKKIIKKLGASGSYLDGGANAPLQRLSLPLMELDFIRKDAWALQRHFRAKRDYLLKHLKEIGIKVQWDPTATFYIWGDLSGLPPPLSDSLVFLEECCKHKVICVPGVFFDINPRGIRQDTRLSPCNQNIRFSYGPPMKNLENGVKAIREMIQKWKDSPESPEEYAESSFDE